MKKSIKLIIKKEDVTQPRKTWKFNPVERIHDKPKYKRVKKWREEDYKNPLLFFFHYIYLFISIGFVMSKNERNTNV